MSGDMSEGWRQKSVMEQQKAMAAQLRSAAFQNALERAVDMLTEQQRAELLGKLPVPSADSMPPMPLHVETVALGFLDANEEVAAIIRGRSRQAAP